MALATPIAAHSQPFCGLGGRGFLDLASGVGNLGIEMSVHSLATDGLIAHGIIADADIVGDRFRLYQLGYELMSMDAFGLVKNRSILSCIGVGGGLTYGVPDNEPSELGWSLWVSSIIPFAPFYQVTVLPSGTYHQLGLKARIPVTM